MLNWPDMLPTVLMGTVMLSIMTWLAVLLLRDAHRERRARKADDEEYAALYRSMIDSIESEMRK